MKRKVIQLAGKTHVISLPSKWVKRHNVLKGNELDIEERGNKIIVSTEAEVQKSKVVFDMEKIGLFHKNYIAFLYHKGCDEIEIRYNSPDTFPEIQQSISNLMGFEIVEHGRNFCRIRNVSSMLDSEFDTLLRRSFLVTLEMGEGIVELLKKNKLDGLNELVHLERTNDRFTDFCKRLLNKKGYKEIEKTSLVYALLRDLEEVGDHYRHICSTCINRKVSPSKETIKLFEEVNSYFRLLYELYYKFDKNKASQLIFRKKDLLQKLEDVFMKIKNNDEKLLLHHLMNLTNSVFDMYGPCFTLNI